MTTVGNLGRIRKRFEDCLPVSAVSVTSDDFDLRMLTQPGSDRRRLAIRQQFDDGTPLKIADQRPIALSLAPGPVVDPDDARSQPMVRTPDAAPRRKVSLLRPNRSRRPSAWAGRPPIARPR